VNGHDQDTIACHDFDHAAHNSLSVTGKRSSTQKRSLSACLTTKDSFFKFQKSFLLSRGKEGGGGERLGAARKLFRISSFFLSFFTKLAISPAVKCQIRG